MRQMARVRLATIIAVIGVISTNISTSQQPRLPNLVKFEVAAIKPGDPKLGMYSSFSTGGGGGQLHMVNMPLKQWIEMGLSIRDWALVGPPWLGTARFDLTARLPVGQQENKDAQAEMMKSLLVERFGLKWHQEIQNVSGYQLVIDKKILVKPSGFLERLHGHGSSSGPAFIGGTNMSMSELAVALEKALGKPVVDATHVSDVFDIRLIWSPSDAASAAEEKKYGIDVDNLPSSVATALREQLGLRLQSAKVPSKVIVVDHINPRPTEN